MCACQGNKNNGRVVTQKYVQTASIASPPVDCDKSIEEVLSVQQVLMEKKTPLNSGYINEQLGKIQTMVNRGNFCLYDLSSIVI